MASRLAATSRIVWLISSSVSESSDDVASSNTSSCGRRSSARAIDSRCFSPPETLTPPSPITRVEPAVGARQQALRRRPARSTSRHSSSVASGRTKRRFSRIEPENSWASWVTKPMRSRRPSISTSSSGDAVVVDVARSAGGTGRPAVSRAWSSPPRTVRRTRWSRRALTSKGDLAAAPARGRLVLESRRRRSAAVSRKSTGTGCSGRGSGGRFEDGLRSSAATLPSRGRC